MNVVALDIGNSDIKFGLFRHGELVKFWRASDFIPVQRSGPQYKKPASFSQALRSGLSTIGSSFDGLVYSSVMPELEEILKQTLKYCFTLKRPPLAIKPGFTRLPLKVEGYSAGQLGTDRLVSACGAYLMYPNQHIILADFGTATTFDVITADGRFLGGVIAPGIEAFSSTLPQRASQLPYVPFGPCEKAIGQSTVECMQSGVSFGYLGMVKEILERMRLELTVQQGLYDVMCLATGGSAESFLNAFPANGLFAQVEPTMTIKGLYALYAEAHQPKRKVPVITATPIPLQPIHIRVPVPEETQLPFPDAPYTVDIQPMDSTSFNSPSKNLKEISPTGPIPADLLTPPEAPPNHSPAGHPQNLTV
ncbi:MAG: type III pantothenate kinase [Vampirovibrionales bacterium]|nr:type III pantothenate kinase [Vampirovibrionales bacterium]